jgi:hypothetical protein
MMGLALLVLQIQVAQVAVRQKMGTKQEQMVVRD